MNGQFHRFPFILNSDFLIIGAGVIGLSAALELAERGASVTVLDQGQPGHESSWAGGGILSPLLPWHYCEAVTRLCEFSRQLFPQWCSHLSELSGVEPEYLETGMLVLPPFDQVQSADWCATHGWPWDIRSGLEFGVESSCPEALWLPTVAQVRNPRLIKALRGAAESIGVRVVEYCEVVQMDRSETKLTKVITNKRGYSAEKYIVAAGSWTGVMPGLERLQQHVFPVRGQMLLFNVQIDALRAVVFQEGRYLIPRKDGHILAGSTTELVGFDRLTTKAAKENLLSFAGGLMANLNEQTLVRQWSGLRPGSHNNIPLICRHSDYDNLFISTGHFRYGVTMAPGTAKLLAGLIFSEVPQIPVDAYEYPATP